MSVVLTNALTSCILKFSQSEYSSRVLARVQIAHIVKLLLPNLSPYFYLLLYIYLKP